MQGMSNQGFCRLFIGEHYMSRSQLFGLAFGFALIFFVAICPPWYSAYESYGAKLGRGLLWTPPEDRTMISYSRVDGEQLFAEITAISSLTGLVVAGLGMTSIRSE